MYSVMDYRYITTRSLCPIFWEMPTTNIFNKSELILCVNRGWGWSIGNPSSQWWTHCVDAPAFSSTTKTLWPCEYDWGFSINKRLFTNTEKTDKTGVYPMVYYYNINCSIYLIMDTTNYVTVIFCLHDHDEYTFK